VKKLAVLALWTLCLGGTALASGRDVATEAALASAAGQQQALRLNDQARMKNIQPEGIAPAGLKGAQPGDAGEESRLPGAGLQNRQQPQGHPGELSQPRQ